LPTWVLWTLILGVALGGALVWYGLEHSPAGPQLGLPPEAGTTGTTGEPHRGRTPTPGGATSGLTAEGDTQYFRLPAGARAGDVVGTYDRQLLYLVDPKPVEMFDGQMLLEERANELKDAPKHRLYVPAVSETTEIAATRFYYLKVGENRFLKVTLQPPEEEQARSPRTP
jgi:hypothetical protein